MAFLVCASCIYASGKETRHRRAVDPEYLRVTVRSEATVRIRDGRLDLKRVQRELFERPMMAPSLQPTTAALGVARASMTAITSDSINS